MTPSASGKSEPVEPRATTRGKLIIWLPVVLYSLLIVVASSMPASRLPKGGLWRYDKLIHAAEYAVLGGLLVRGIVRAVVTRRIGLALLVAAVIAVAFGASDEVHQLATPGRDSSWGDLLADGVGALVGAALVAVWYGVTRRARSSRPPVESG